MTVRRYHRAERDRLVLVGLQRGRTNAQLAADLGLQPSTVKTYVFQVCESLGAHNRAQAVYIAQVQGLLGAPAGRKIVMLRGR